MSRWPKVEFRGAIEEARGSPMACSSWRHSSSLPVIPAQGEAQTTGDFRMRQYEKKLEFSKRGLPCRASMDGEADGDGVRKQLSVLREVQIFETWSLTGLGLS